MLDTLLIYPPELPVDAIYTTKADKAWKPDYPLFIDTQRIYVFYKPDQRVWYIGKAHRVRDRVRWHMSGNTFAPKQTTDLWLDVITVRRELTADQLSYRPIIEYEAMLIGYFLPIYNANIKKTVKQLQAKAS